jgi:hypothetical protein
MQKRFVRGVERIAGAQGLLVRLVLVVVLSAVAGLGMHLIAELIARPDAIQTSVLDGFSQRLVGDKSIATELVGRPQRHFSECIAFSILTNSRVEGALSRIMKMEANLWTPPDTMCSIYLAGASDATSVQWFSYARYWHGYLIFHKVILSFVDYRAFLKLINTLLVTALIVFAVTLARRFQLFPTLVLLVIFLLLSPGLWSWLNPTNIVSFSSLLLIGAYFDRYGADRAFPEATCVAVFAGAVFNFFDFLYFPALLAAMVCWLRAIHQVGSRTATIDRTPLLLGVASLTGYLAMWAVKWGIGFIWIEQVQAPMAVDFSRWMFGGGGPYVPFAATVSILDRLLQPILSLGLVCVVAVAYLLLAVRFRTPFLLYTLRTSVLPAALGVVVLEGLARHSFAHGFSDWVVAWLVATFAFNCARYVNLPPSRLRRSTGRVERRHQKLL